VFPYTFLCFQNYAFNFLFIFRN